MENPTKETEKKNEEIYEVKRHGRTLYTSNSSDCFINLFFHVVVSIIHLVVLIKFLGLFDRVDDRPEHEIFSVLIFERCFCESVFVLQVVNPTIHSIILIKFLSRLDHRDRPTYNTGSH